jgi:hypothetical protein
VVLMVLACLVGGCGSATKHADACADAMRVVTYYTTDAPEAKGFNAAVAKRYKGTDAPGEYQAAFDAYVAAYRKALRPVADETTNADLKAAITATADNFGGTDTTGLDKLATLCPNATPTPTVSGN